MCGLPGSLPSRTTPDNFQVGYSLNLGLRVGMECVVRVADRKTETIAVILTELEWMLKNKKKAKERNKTTQRC